MISYSLFLLQMNAYCFTVHVPRASSSRTIYVGLHERNFPLFISCRVYRIRFHFYMYFVCAISYNEVNMFYICSYKYFSIYVPLLIYFLEFFNFRNLKKVIIIKGCFIKVKLIIYSLNV